MAITDRQYAVCQKLKSRGFCYCGKKKSAISKIRLARWRKDYMFEGIRIGHTTILVDEEGFPSTSSGKTISPNLREDEEGLSHVAELNPMSVDEAIFEMNAEFDEDIDAAFFSKQTDF